MTNLFLRFCSICALLILSACGGGGSDGGKTDGGSRNLTLNVSYVAHSTDLYYPTTFLPSLSGFQGYAPNCSLVEDSVPNGMVFSSNCSVFGTPTTMGNFTFRFRVTAVGASGTSIIEETLSVRGPILQYPNHIGTGSLRVGDPVTDAASLGWVPPSGLATAWTYTITSGSLPTGLTLNATTGVISGTATVAGNYLAEVQGTLNTTFGTHVSNLGRYEVIVAP